MVYTTDSYGQSAYQGRTPGKSTQSELGLALVKATESEILGVLENNFAICPLLEIPLRGFSFQLKVYEKCRTSNNNIISFKGFCLKIKSPQGDLKQEACREHPVLACGLTALLAPAVE